MSLSKICNLFEIATKDNTGQLFVSEFGSDFIDNTNKTTKHQQAIRINYYNF